jgi:hypothetical protein
VLSVLSDRSNKSHTAARLKTNPTPRRHRLQTSFSSPRHRFQIPNPGEQFSDVDDTGVGELRNASTPPVLATINLRELKFGKDDLLHTIGEVFIS